MAPSPAVSCPACGRAATSAEQRFCGGCGAVLPASSETATNLAPPAAVPPPLPTAASPDDARFLPGTVLAGRYRMVGLLGRGGMGEVYRADDLKLGQPVALKFLPVDVERDPDRLDRFLTEVRLSLRVTHPNICRVFDVGQLDPGAGATHPRGADSGRVRHFLTMEYVDGEDLASLLRRIGRLPEDKAIEIARQLCAGLAAAHDEGVLHRDLKPANIMIDGRGRAKIADFGLASAGRVSGQDARAGTPQYMAPEQIAGREITERTDLYALGLVLYELFTGKRAFEIANLDDLQRLQSSAPTSPSSHVSGLSPLVEHAILRCLDPDPSKRPASAAALAAALPGGDPLAMAIAAGDTPSPEMVAAAGAEVRLRPATAWAIVVAMAGAMGVAAVMDQGTVLYRAAAPARPPAVLIERAREALRDVGLGDAALDSAWGLTPNHRFLTYMAGGQSLDPSTGLVAHGVWFWYRETPIGFERWLFLTGPDLLQRVTHLDPPLRYAGELMLFLDRDGRLGYLAAVPPAASDPESAAGDADWAPLFQAAGRDISQWAPAEPVWTPQFHADRRYAWTPVGASGEEATRIEAASFRGRPVAFAVVYPWSVPDRQQVSIRSPGERIGNLIGVLIFCGVMLGGGLVARRNLRLERGDTRGATRLAAAVTTLLMAVWAIDESHVASIWELYLFLLAAGWALFMGALVAVFYLALEPYVRRTWPGMIVSWSRAIAGTIRDPLVARDVLFGIGAGAAIRVIEASGFVLTGLITGIPPRVLTAPRPFLGTPQIASSVGLTLVWAIFYALVLLFVMFTLRRLLRREALAIAAGAVLMTLGLGLETGTLLGAVPTFVLSLLLFTLLARVGLVATVAAVFTFSLLVLFPTTIPPAGWYAGVGVVGPALLLGLAALAVRVATDRLRGGERPSIR